MEWKSQERAAGTGIENDFSNVIKNVVQNIN